MKINEVAILKQTWLFEDTNQFVHEQLPWLQQQLELDSLPEIELLDAPQTTSFGTYGGGKLRVVTGGRHPVDVLRTIAHELTHYKQDLEGRLHHESGATGSEEENEANSNAGIIMRDFAQENPDQFGINEDLSRRGFLGAVGAGAAAAAVPGVAQAKITPQPVADNPKVELLLKWAKKFITNPNELAAFMAQCAHESANFTHMEEIGSPERFAKRYDIQHNPQKAKQLGNDKPGDGIKYRGRGYIQLTGKYNYQKAGEWLSKYLNANIDFVSKPDLVATPTAAALSSIWYWMTFVHPKAKNFSNTKQVTKHINPGLKGQANREQKARDWQAALTKGKKTQVAMKEIFEPGTAFVPNFEIQGKSLYATAYDRQGREINITMGPGGIPGAVDIEFMRGGSFDLTGKGDAERVFGTVLMTMRHYFETLGIPEFIVFHSKEGSRSKLYQALVLRYAGRYGYQQVDPNNPPESIAEYLFSTAGLFILQKKHLP